jgi:hypothetical protein
VYTSSQKPKTVGRIRIGNFLVGSGCLAVDTTVDSANIHIGVDKALMIIHRN